MKRRIKSAKELTIEDMFGSLINDVMNNGYDIVITGETVPEIRIAPNKDFNKMPNIQVTVDVDSNGDCTFNATLEFPTLDTSKFDHPTDGEYWLSKWNSAAKIITSLMNTQYNIHDLENYQSEEE